MDRKYYKENLIVSHLLMNFNGSETPLLSRSLTFFPVLHPPWRQSSSQKHSEFLWHLAWSLFFLISPDSSTQIQLDVLIIEPLVITILTPSSNTFDAHQRESATMIKQPSLKMTNLVGTIAELLTAPTNSPAPCLRLWLWTEFSVASSLSILSLEQYWKGWFLSPITRPFGDGEGGHSPRRMENGRRTWSSDEE